MCTRTRFIQESTLSLSSPIMLLLRISISNTKEFFQKTLQNFKSFFFCQGYQKLPKTPYHNNHFSCSVAEASVMDLDPNNQNYENLENFYNDFIEQRDSKKEKASKRTQKKNPAKQEKEEHNNASPTQKNNKMEERTEECENKNNNKRSCLTHHRGGRKHQDSSSKNNAVVVLREHRNCLVEKKLKELEMLEMSDVDHVLDIEEVLHYYSRLTCPLYLEIVDNFFMEIYTEFFNPARPASPHSVNSKLKLRSLRS